MVVSVDVGVVLIGWVIIVVGMFIFVFVFQIFVNCKFEFDGGVYVYVKVGFGDYMGFFLVWGYWISVWLGNVGYFVLLFSIFGYFFLIFGKGDIVVVIVCVLVLFWVLYFLVLCGIKEVVFINIVIIVVKIVLLFLFILICLFVFKLDIFIVDIWGKSNLDLGSVMNQVCNMMLVIVWVFIGIEGVSIFFFCVEKCFDVGKVIVIGFIIVLFLLVLVNVLFMGVMIQLELVKLQNLLMVLVFEYVVGYWGVVLISVGLLILLLGVLFFWVLLCVEIMFVVVKDYIMLEFLCCENVNQVLVNVLWLINICVQVFLVVVFFILGDLDGMDLYIKMLFLVISMILILYFWFVVYGLLLILKGEIYENDVCECSKDLVIVGIVVVYVVWLFYVGGLKYLLLFVLLYVFGVIFFVKVKYEVGQLIFIGIEKLIFVVVVIGVLVVVYGFYDGFFIF